MPIDVIRYNSCRDSIRNFLILPDDEIVIDVFLASILCNFDLERQVPTWLVIVGSPSSAKTELASLIQGWQHTWSLPDPLTPGYFFSSRNRKESALSEIEASGKRILYLHDMITLLTANPRDAGQVYSQLIGVHDGFLHHRTGYNPESLTYGPKAPNERLGFVATATEKFYTFQERWFQFGSRFLLYYLKSPKRDWSDTSFLSDVHELSDVSYKREQARQHVHSFLDHGIEQLHEFPEVTIDKDQVDRLSAAVTLITRILGARGTADPGVRLHRRVIQLVRMLAFLEGRPEVTNAEVVSGIQIILAQLPIEYHRILLFSMHPKNLKTAWKIDELLAWAGGGRKLYSDPLEMLGDIRVLHRDGSQGRYGYTWKLGSKSLELVRKFDPDEILFPAFREDAV